MATKKAKAASKKTPKLPTSIDERVLDALAAQDDSEPCRGCFIKRIRSIHDHGRYNGESCCPACPDDGRTRSTPDGSRTAATLRAPKLTWVRAFLGEGFPLAEIATRFQIDVTSSAGSAGKPDPIR